MSPLLLQMFVLLIPHMGHWTDHQKDDFCEQLDPYIKHMASEGLSDKEEEELIEFLNMIIQVEESE